MPSEAARAWIGISCVMSLVTGATRVPNVLQQYGAPIKYHRLVSTFRQPLFDATDPAVFPTDFGADPTGRNDSTQAFAAAVQALLQHNTSGHTLSFGVADLGGATLDLAGGDYLISAPIIIPQYYGNFRIVSGTLRASSTFPSTRYLIEIGATTCSNGQGSCNENAAIEGVMLDASQTAAGGVHIMATMGAVIGPQAFLFNFTQAGILIDGGHEVMVTETWLGEFAYSDRRKENGTASTATGIMINGNDHVVANTIVFSSHVGVAVNGAANLLTGVHTWNLATGNNGTGILLNSGQNRLIGCYLDWDDLVITSPQLTTVVDGFFLGGGRLRIAPKAANTAIDGLYVSGNQWMNYGGSAYDTVVVDGSYGGTIGSVRDATIVGSMVPQGTPIHVKSTVATQSVTLSSPSTQWSFNFTGALAFDTSVAPIQRVSYSVMLDGDAFARHTARKPLGGVVVVETDVPVTGTMTVTVDQSIRSGP